MRCKDRRVMGLDKEVEVDVTVDISLSDVHDIMDRLKDDELQELGDKFFADNSVQVDSLHDSLRHEIWVELFPKLTLERLESLKMEIESDGELH